jgi:cationic antimicrobial peptide transport system ATP-binding protein
MGEVIMSMRDVHFQHNLFASLRGLTLEIEEGQGIVVFGMETSGVDVVCHVLSGLEKRYEGSVCYKGCDVLHSGFREQQETRRDMVYVERHYGLMHNMTVLENIMLPLTYHAALSRDEIETLAEG